MDVSANRICFEPNMPALHVFIHPWAHGARHAMSSPAVIGFRGHVCLAGNEDASDDTFYGYYNAMTADYWTHSHSVGGPCPLSLDLHNSSKGWGIKVSAHTCAV